MLISGEHRINIVDGIPRFVENTNYANVFGEQWKKYFDIQLDSYTNTSITRDRTKRSCGADLFDNLEGKLVLEVGCSGGRFTDVLLSQGANFGGIKGIFIGIIVMFGPRVSILGGDHNTSVVGKYMDDIKEKQTCNDLPI